MGEPLVSDIKPEFQRTQVDGYAMHRDGIPSSAMNEARSIAMKLAAVNNNTRCRVNQSSSLDKSAATLINHTATGRSANSAGQISASEQQSWAADKG